MRRPGVSSVSRPLNEPDTGKLGESPRTRAHARSALRTPALFAVVVAVLIGAGLGAAFHPQSDYRYEAEALVLVDSTSASDTQAALARLQALRTEIFLPHVAEAARRQTGAQGDLLDRLQVEDGPEDGVRIIVRDKSATSAVALANAFAAQAVNFPAIETTDRLLLGNFENGIEQWGSGRSVFSVPPTDLRLVSETPKEGSAALRVVCNGDPGCGVSLRVTRSFRTGITYRTSAWLRSVGASAAPIGLVLGASAEDFATGGGRLRPTWTQYSVDWTPSRNVTGAELSIHVNAARAATFDIDDVALGEQRAAQPPSTLGRRARGEQALNVVPAVPAGTVAGSTLKWALIGAGFGLGVAIVVLWFGQLARSRQQRSDE
jgi:hypothetical protein